MFTSQVSHAWLLVLTSGFGLGILCSLPLVVWVLYQGSEAAKFSGTAKAIAIAISFFLILAAFVSCIYVSIRLVPLMKFVLRLSDSVVLELYLTVSIVGVAIPLFIAIAMTYNWSRNYNVPALKQFFKHFGVILLVAVFVNIATNYFIGPVEPVIFFVSLMTIGFVALAKLDHLRKSPKAVSSRRNLP